VRPSPSLEPTRSGKAHWPPRAQYHGLATAKREQPALVLAEAFAKNPERFPNGRLSPRSLPTAAWINPPAKREADLTGENSGPTVERGRDRRSWGNLEGRYRGRTPREPTSHARGPMHGGCSVNSPSECLNVVDRFQAPTSSCEKPRR
jgi:hypothetical protein